MQFLMRDAAFATSIERPWDQAIAGYLGGPNAYRTWTSDDWDMFATNRKLPIWVAGESGSAEAPFALDALYKLGFKPGCHVAVDMEKRVDVTYLNSFTDCLNFFGYKVLVYGSASTVFGNPVCNGYWVADWTGQPHMFNHPAVRITQWATGNFDSSSVKGWIYNELAV